MKYLEPSEAIKRLAAAQGIDYLNLIKSDEKMQQEMQVQQEMAQQQSLVSQASQFARAPMMDPSKQPAEQQEQQPPTTDV